MRSHWISAGMMAAISLPASAQHAVVATSAAQPIAANGDIVVAAPKRKVVGAQVRSAIGAVPEDVPLARYQAPICVAAAGLSANLLNDITQRMLVDAQTMGMALAGEDCQPNTIVMFVDNARAEVTRMARGHHRGLAGVGLLGRRALIANKGPVFAWRLTAIRSRDGEGGLDGRDLTTVRVYSASRLSLPVRQDVLRSVLIVERSAIVGKTSRQLADYSAMRLFGGALPVRAGGPETILTLFGEGSAAPAELTVFDHGYLRGLYTTPANTLVNWQRSAMTSSAMKKAMQQ